MKTGIELIADERERQVAKEGWTPEHDDGHNNWELMRAGVAYAIASMKSEDRMRKASTIWPWDKDDWKPAKDPVRNLVKAGALLAAEIDRLQRANIQQLTANAQHPETGDGKTA